MHVGVVVPTFGSRLALHGLARPASGDEVTAWSAAWTATLTVASPSPNFELNMGLSMVSKARGVCMHLPDIYT